MVVLITKAEIKTSNAVAAGLLSTTALSALISAYSSLNVVILLFKLGSIARSYPMK
jgi:hypothetical protein